VPLISRFDPWRSHACTCPPKLTFNLYTGCDHACIYCYASSYIPKFSQCRPKKDLLNRLEREARNLKGEVVSMANSSDPYPRMEAASGLTRNCLIILSKCDCRIQITTKSNIVTRDADILSRIPCTVALTITTDDDGVAKLIEPNAPSSSERLKAIEKLAEKDIPLVARLDPVIPFVNDHPERLIAVLASMGVKHLTTSTYKAKPDNWNRLVKVMPKIAEKLKPLYFEQGERAGGYTLLNRGLRFKLLKRFRGLAIKNEMKFGFCRENFGELNTAVCDGSWLMPAERR
jgi:DNA repair photolyase